MAGYAKITWFGGKQFAAVDSSKHSVVLSAQDEANKTGMKPSDLLLVALAGCSAVDVVGILQKKRLDVRGFEINIRGEQDEDPPWTFTWTFLSSLFDVKSVVILFSFDVISFTSKLF